MVNATGQAPVTGAHTTAGTRVTKMVKDVLNQAFSLSSDPELRDRIGAQAWDAAGLTPLVGIGHGGVPTVVFFMDAVGGGGGGAQSQFDGLDTYGMTISPGVSLPSVEVNESKQPALYLWRKLNPDSGGPGMYRGGQSMEFAWAAYQTDKLTGAAVIACAEMPARGAGGGLPAAAGTWNTFHATNVRARMGEGHTVLEHTLQGHNERQPSNVAGLTLNDGDVLRMRCGAGGGLGDPLLRDPEVVLADIRNEYVTQQHAERIYGVTLGGAGEVDTTATAQRRALIRRERLGAEPGTSQGQPETVGISVLHTAGPNGGAWVCGYCEHPLGDAVSNWRPQAVRREYVLTERFAELGMFVKERLDPPRVMLAEFYCPSCAGQLSVDIYPEGFAGYRTPVLAD